ncbi:tRNA-binding protein [Umboniibacter marinipuniceus]|uniref:tRNA-binding protein n=1 Tax=Umboniibacter marinipuniceus TaxID=569599 RepID=A0A3M0AEW6_9GAMM|nr:tRNA-binding protein [Umboniibacter marinipuniceus]RMA80995.1 tRNA-binding protein [Umboniibacter marinipuniceus]
MTISWEDFSKIDLRAGTIVDAKIFEQALRPAYLLWVDFGDELGIKKSSAQITVHYDLNELIGKQVLAVVNFPPKQIGPIRSECLVTGFYDQNGDVVLAVPERALNNGAKLG